MKYITTDMFGSISINSLTAKEAADMHLYLLEAIANRRNSNRPQNVNIATIAHELGQLLKKK